MPQDLLFEALEFAAQAHKGQVRKHSNLPYMVHPMEVLKRVRNYGITDEEILCACILHDVVEDTVFTVYDIAENFGERVAVLVSEMTQETSMTKSQYLRTFRVKSKDAVMIKVADTFCNTNDFINDKPSYASTNALQRKDFLEIASAVFKDDHRILSDVIFIKKVGNII